MSFPPAVSNLISETEQATAKGDFVTACNLCRKILAFDLCLEYRAETYKVLRPSGQGCLAGQSW